MFANAPQQEMGIETVEIVGTQCTDWMPDGAVDEWASRCGQTMLTGKTSEFRIDMGRKRDRRPFDVVVKRIDKRGARLVAQAQAVPSDELTARELEIAQMLCEDLGNKAIAKALSLAENTIQTHTRNIFRKVGVSGVAGLVRYALRNGIIEF